MTVPTSRGSFRSLKIAAMSVALLLTAGQIPVRAQGSGNGYAWPYLIVSGMDSIWLYQPQAISWSNQTLTGSQAVSIKSMGETQQRYGVVYFQATTNDAGSGRVTLSNYSITKQNFPSLSDNGAAMSQTILANAGALPPLNQEKIKDDITLSRSTNQGPGTAGVMVRNDPPVVLHSNDPALLLLIDGDPKLTPVQGTPYQRIMNSNSLILTDGSSYYTPVGDKWAVSADLNNPNWSVTPSVDALNNAKNIVQEDKNVNLVIPDNTSDEVTAAAQNGTIPLLYVSTRPAELLITNGPPDFTPVDGTNLLYAQNAKGDLFKSIDDNRTYTLLSGRWYSAPTIDGPWTWVDPSQLPADFAKIPQNHPEARVLVSVPNTTQANEAMIANTIPQTATVDRSQATFTATYDGDPKFKPISGTDMEYAVNASSPIIRDGDAFYACDKGVWFVGSGPMGPWAVADHVPDEIYNIPSNSPVYNVTYVKVYDEDPDDVTFGYTPGYFGIYDAWWGCPVYGTGWWYRPWCGDYWWPSPWTFGYGACFGWTPYIGFGAFFNFGFGLYSPFYRPWWGPWHWYRPYGFYGGLYANRVNIYEAWGHGWVRTNYSPAFGRGGGIVRNGGGLYRPGTPITRINGISRGNIYGSRVQSNSLASRAGAIGNRPGGAFMGQQRAVQPGGNRVTTNGMYQARGAQGQYQQRNTQNYQQRNVQNYQQRGGQTYRPAQNTRSYAPSRSYSRSYSAPARSFGGGGGYRGGGGGGGFHGGGGRR